MNLQDFKGPKNSQNLSKTKKPELMTELKICKLKMYFHKKKVKINKIFKGWKGYLIKNRLHTIDKKWMKCLNPQSRLFQNMVMMSKADLTFKRLLYQKSLR